MRVAKAWAIIAATCNFLNWSSTDACAQSPTSESCVTSFSATALTTKCELTPRALKKSSKEQKSRLHSKHAHRKLALCQTLVAIRSCGDRAAFTECVIDDPIVERLAYSLAVGDIIDAIGVLRALHSDPTGPRKVNLANDRADKIHDGLALNHAVVIKDFFWGPAFHHFGIFCNGQLIDAEKPLTNVPTERQSYGPYLEETLFLPRETSEALPVPTVGAQPEF